MDSSRLNLVDTGEKPELQCTPLHSPKPETLLQAASSSGPHTPPHPAIPAVQPTPPSSPDPETPPRSPPHSASFEAYIDEQYAITLALLGEISIDSLTTSQRAAVHRIQEGKRGWKPSRIPRPTANYHSQRRFNKSSKVHSRKYYINKGTMEAPAQVRVGRRQSSADNCNTTLISKDEESIHQTCTEPQRDPSVDVADDKIPYKSERSLDLSIHKGKVRTQAQNSKASKLENTPEDNLQGLQGDDIPEGQVYQDSKPASCKVFKDKDLIEHQKGMNEPTRAARDEGENSNTREECVGQPPGVIAAERHEFREDWREEHQVKGDPVSTPLGESDGRHSQCLPSVPQQGCEHDEHGGTLTTSTEHHETAQELLHHSQCGEGECQWETTPLNGCSKLANNLETIHADSQHKGSKQRHTVDGYRQKYEERTQREKGHVRKPPCEDKQLPLGYLQRYLLKTTGAHCGSTQSTPADLNTKYTTHGTGPSIPRPIPPHRPHRHVTYRSRHVTYGSAPLLHVTHGSAPLLHCDETHGSAPLPHVTYGYSSAPLGSVPLPHVTHGSAPLPYCDVTHGSAPLPLYWSAPAVHREPRGREGLSWKPQYYSSIPITAPPGPYQLHQHIGRHRYRYSRLPPLFPPLHLLPPPPPPPVPPPPPTSSLPPPDGLPYHPTSMVVDGSPRGRWDYRHRQPHRTWRPQPSH